MRSSTWPPLMNHYSIAGEHMGIHIMVFGVVAQPGLTTYCVGSERFAYSEGRIE